MGKLAKREGRGGRRMGKGVAIRVLRYHIGGQLVMDTLVPRACTEP
jgi:hypothetical protein